MPAAATGSCTETGRSRLRRKLITSRNPESGHVDLPTLDVLGSYRRDEDTTEPLPFGIYAEVLRPGTISIGDPVTPDG